MQFSNNDSAFAGSIPELYERYMVPLIFEPYAADLALRISQQRPERVLEIAAVTGWLRDGLRAHSPQKFV
jgi:hypothetical protein